MTGPGPWGPKSRAPWGLLPKFHRDPLGLLHAVARQYPDLAALPFGPWTLYLASGESAVEDVLRPHKDHFHKGPGMEADNPLTGQGLLLTEDDVWRDQRKAIAPVFGRGTVLQYQPIMERGIEHLTGQFFSKGALDVGQFGRHLALWVTLAALFGTEPDAMQLDQVSRATQGVMAHYHQRARSVVRPPYRWPTIFNRHFYALAAELTQFVKPLLEHPPSALLEILAQSSPDRGVQEAVTFLIAGHETTGNALAWTLLLLADHPDSVLRVQQEASEVPEQRPYTEAVVLESLRLYPPVWLLSRRSIRPVEVCGYVLPAHASFLISPFVSHRIESYYADADAFRPERWLEDGARVRHSRTDYRFLAFGGGPRRCPGEGFAMAELTLAISFICQHWQLRALASSWPQAFPGMTLAPEGDLRIMATAP